MIAEEYIKQVVLKIINNSGIFLVDIQVKPTNKIFIEIDDDKGININQCAEISREIEKYLNRDYEDFELNVSSPGLDKAFKVKEQYKKNIGKELNIQTIDGKNLTGVLKKISLDNIIIVKTDSKVMNSKWNNIKIELSKIKYAKLVLKY